MRMPSTIAFALWICFGLIFVGAAAASASDMPPLQEGTNLDDCVERLQRLGGGWCEIRLPGEHPSISAVWPQNLDRKTRFIVGPKAILGAWGGAAFDEENKLLYFTGGGHADYGGNEVYEFDLKTGQWTRLTDPSPLDFLVLHRPASEKRPARYCWVPDLRQVPGAAHSYDALQFSRATRTIFYARGGIGVGACFNDTEREVQPDDPRLFTGEMAEVGAYEFNPSRTEMRNGLAPLTWRRLFTIDTRATRIKRPRSVELPDGSLLIGGHFTLYRFDPKTGRLGERAETLAAMGDGPAVYHPDGYVISLLNSLTVHDVSTGIVQTLSVPGLHGKGLAADARGRLVTWNGAGLVMTLDFRAGERTWRLFDWGDQGPPNVGGRGVYSKWQYIEDQDVFVGLASHTTGVWVYKHPDGMEGIEISNLNIQQVVDQAKPGSIVTIPAGVYGQGLFIGKSLTVNAKDAHLWGIAEKKGIVNVKCDNCSVVLEDFHGEGRKAGCLEGNCAGIKAEGVNFDLTVKRAHIDNTVMGILTDNRGGRLVIEDSLIENTGLDDSTKTLGHSIYAGKINSLVVRRSTIRNTNGDGHILKSRAEDTEIEDVRLLGEQGFHSRAIDFSCGGALRVTNSVIQHGENTDNPDMIAVGTERRSCGEIRPSEVSITNSWIIIDRDRSADERARKYGPNFLFRWRAPMASLELRGNHFVNLDRWSTTDAEKGEIAIPDYSSQNVICDDRGDCGLQQDQLPPL